VNLARLAGQNKILLARITARLWHEMFMAFTGSDRLSDPHARHGQCSDDVSGTIAF